MQSQTLKITLPNPHAKQRAFIESKAKRRVVRAGRRGGKTVGISILAETEFLAGRRVLYAAPTAEQIDRFWTEVCRAFRLPIEAGVFVKNETKHIIELPGTEQRIRAKTAWNADSLRGDYADVLILDEYQLMDETAWSEVGAPMLLDNDGIAVFVYTPPSLHSRSASKARDPQHAAKLYKRAQLDTTGRWATFHFSSHDNPHISATALTELSGDMTQLAIRQEIEALDIDQAPGALWKREKIDESRVLKAPDLDRVVVAIDPSATSGGDEAGIIGAGRTGDDYYTVADESIQGSPTTWATAAITLYHRLKADCIIGEGNNGGEMIETVIKQIDQTVNYKMVHASRGKATRAEPISAIHEKGKDHHVGVFPLLENELCLWQPGDNSPNRLDAKVWAMTELSRNIETDSSWTNEVGKVENYQSPWA